VAAAMQPFAVITAATSCSCCLTLAGEQMRVASGEFASDPCSTMKRGAMVRAARALLSSVTRLLIIADMVDVHLMLKSLRIVRLLLLLALLTVAEAAGAECMWSLKNICVYLVCGLFFML